MARKGAEPGDWQSVPLPELNAVLDYQTRFTTEELTEMLEGLLPEEMEDKWFIVFAEDDRRLRFYRSWTGFCIYELGFVDDADGMWMPYDVRVNRDPDQYSRTDDAEDITILDWLIHGLLLGQWSAPPLDNPLAGWSEFGAASLGPGYEEIARGDADGGFRNNTP